MKKRKCSICDKIKPINRFFKRKESGDGYRRDCKNCHTERIKRWYSTPKGYAVLIRTQKKYWKTKKGRLSQQRGHKKYYLKNRKKRAAKAAVWNEVRHKRIPKITAQICKMCGNQANHYHHHKGYAFKYRLSVTPLCTFCHKKAHLPAS